MKQSSLYVYTVFCVCGIVLWHSLHFKLLCHKFSHLWLISLWAGLSSSDRKNTILSGKCKRTRGDSGSLGDLQAHHPRPLAAYTPSTPPPNTNKNMDTPNTHMHAIPFLTRQIASLHHGSSPALSHCLPTYFCSVINRLSFHLSHLFS